jgi:hypothetical protein
LSAVIPYIVGKSVTNHQVTKTVETILKEQKIENERNYRDAIEQLEGAEAHLSRMISYSLLYDVQSIDFAEDIKDNESKLDPRAHPFWAIGWAAKAMIRYVKIAPMFHTKNFVTYCVDYILLSSEMIEKIKVTENLLKDANLDFKNKVLRAFIDLFDAMGFYYSYESNDRLGFKLDKVKELDLLNKTLASLYDKLIKGKDKGKVQGCGLNPEDVALEVAKKSKYCVYLSDASRFNEYFNHWVNNIDNDNRFPRKFYR